MDAHVLIFSRMMLAQSVASQKNFSISCCYHYDTRINLGPLARGGEFIIIYLTHHAFYNLKNQFTKKVSYQNT